MEAKNGTVGWFKQTSMIAGEVTLALGLVTLMGGIFHGNGVERLLSLVMPATYIIPAGIILLVVGVASVVFGPSRWLIAGVMVAAIGSLAVLFGMERPFWALLAEIPSGFFHILLAVCLLAASFLGVLAYIAREGWRLARETELANRSLKQQVVERKQAQDSLAQQAWQLAYSNVDLEQFAYVASHDLQEPLRMIRSYGELLTKRYAGKLDSDAMEFLGYIVDGATRMKDLIDGLLLYSRVTTRGQPLKPTDVQAVLNRVLSNLKVAIEESRAAVTYDYLPHVMGDPTQLEQLFQNLIGNAVKFRGSDVPKIHIKADREDGKWLFSIRDNGIGMDPESTSRIFGMFQRLHDRSEYPGTGVGLAVCKKIVARHGGQIRVESERGKGSTFYFSLPRVQLKISD